MKLKAEHRSGILSKLVLGALFVAVALAGCVSTPSPHNDYELQTLLEEYQLRSAEIESERQQRMFASIRRVDVARGPGTGGFVVSVDLAGAPVSAVVDEILVKTGTGYDFSDITLGGSATARFERLPLLDALNQLVNPQGVSVVQQRGILVFRRGVRMQPEAVVADAGDGENDDDEGGSGGNRVYQVVPLRNLKTEDAATLLKGLYNFENADEPAVNIGELPERNAVYLGGSARDVADAVAVLRQADQDVPHVLIEAFVVEYDVEAIEQLGIELSDATIGDFTDVNLIPGQVGSNVAFTFLKGLSDPTQLTAVIDLLANVDKAQILSRPYLATRSNQQAKIEVVTERFVAVDTNNGGVDVTSSESIDAGVTLDITPTVLADGMIRLDMQVEESEFEPTVAGVLVQKGRSSTQTSMSVASGQTIVVGGLNRRRHTAGNAGIPGLRRIPVLGLLFSKESSVQRDIEVVVYLTPYVWRPSMGLPIPRPDFPSARRGNLTDIEMRAKGLH